MHIKYLIIIAGPTAIGKTEMAVKLAKHFGTEIINADSRQVYHEMIIGTAVPSIEQQAGVKHHFINHLSIHDYYNASRFEIEVVELLDQLFQKYDTVIMAGGSGMYIDAVCKGIDDIPTVDSDVRERIYNEYKLLGTDSIRSKLRNVDPDYYEKVDLKNPKRIMKALEIAEMTGRPYSSFLTGKSKPRSFSVIKIGLDMPRERLHDRINTRTDNMILEGLLQEAGSLYPFRHLNALNTVGYKELFDYLDKRYSFEETIEIIKGHTRQYARRQLTWFRKDKKIQWFLPDEPDTILTYLHKKIGH
jgi:tRNA dimethylallyltransferase